MHNLGCLLYSGVRTRQLPGPTSGERGFCKQQNQNKQRGSQASLYTNGVLLAVLIEVCFQDKVKVSTLASPDRMAILVHYFWIVGQSRE